MPHCFSGDSGLAPVAQDQVSDSSLGPADVQSTTFQHRTGTEGSAWRGRGGLGGEVGGWWGGVGEELKRRSPTGAGYRITQIILPQRSIPQELFAARLLHKSALPPPTQLVSLALSRVSKTICTETPVVVARPGRLLPRGEAGGAGGELARSRWTGSHLRVQYNQKSPITPS